MTTGEGRGAKGEGRLPGVEDGYLRANPQPSTLNPQPARQGLTLYEVLLALLIMLVSMAILGSHLSLGTRAAVTSNLRGEAALLCETKLDEVLAGIEPMQSGGGPITSSLEGEWSWSLVVVPGQPHVDTLSLEVYVERAATDGFAPVAFSLRRVVRDPALYDVELTSEAVTTEGSQ